MAKYHNITKAALIAAGFVALLIATPALAQTYPTRQDLANEQWRVQEELWQQKMDLERLRTQQQQDLWQSEQRQRDCHNYNIGCY